MVALNYWIAKICGVDPLNMRISFVAMCRLLGDNTVMHLKRQSQNGRQVHTHPAKSLGMHFHYTSIRVKGQHCVNMPDQAKVSKTHSLTLYIISLFKTTVDNLTKWGDNSVMHLKEHFRNGRRSYIQARSTSSLSHHTIIVAFHYLGNS